MARNAVEQDKNLIYNLWQSSFSIRSSDALNCFFNYAFEDGKCVIGESDNRIISTVFMNDMNIMLNGRYLKSVFLSHAATHPDYRYTNMMDETMKSVLAECDRKALFTFAIASNPKFWENYGFQCAVMHRTFEFTPEYFYKTTSEGVSADIHAQEMLDMYNAFMKRFDGYKARTLEDMEYILKEASECHERVLAVRINDKCQGYIRFSIHNKQVRVKELIYSGSTSLLRLLKAALAQHDSIIVEVSEAEHLEKVFPLALPRKRMAVMVRCNNFPLFNKLYGVKVKTSKDAYNISKKPSYMNERF